MAKTITRQTLQLFGGSGSSTNFAQFGSQAAGSPVKTKTISTIQQLSAYLNGWQNAVALGNAPYLEDMNALFYLLCYQQVYQFQEGVAEWDAGTTYFVGSLVKKAGTFELYGSLNDSNLNNALPAQADNANWQYLGLATALQNGLLGQQNIAINGGFEIWQRGTSFSSGGYTADRWYLNGTGSPVFTIVKETTVVDIASSASLKLTCTTFGPGQSLQIRQRVENPGDYSGLTVTLSMRVKSSTAGFSCALITSGGIPGSGATAGSGAWETITVTTTVPAGNTQLEILFQTPASISGAVVYIDNVMFTASSQYVPFIPRRFQQELAMCQRYYAKSYDLATPPGSLTSAGAWMANAVTTSFSMCNVPFPMRMRVSPTLTLYSPEASNATGQIYTPVQGTGSARTVTGPILSGEYGFGGIQSVAAFTNGESHKFHWTADAEL